MQAFEVYACISHVFSIKKPCGQTLFDACDLESVRFRFPLSQFSELDRMQGKGAEWFLSEQELIEMAGEILV